MGWRNPSMTEWITDRLPAEEEADSVGDVVMQTSASDIYRFKQWHKVRPGEGWQPSPYKEKERTTGLPRIEAGQTWRQRGGGTVVLHETQRDGTVLAGNGVLYPKSGHDAPGMGEEYDLVALVSDKQPVVRTFRSITRTYLGDTGIMIIDAVADDGTAWARIVDLGSNGTWLAHPPLPQPDQDE